MDIFLKSAITLFMAFTAPAPAHAQSTSSWRLHPHEDHIDVVDPSKRNAVRLYHLEDVLGDTFSEMLVLAQEKIQFHTKKEQAEVCGLICVSPSSDRFGIKLFTAKSHLACPVFNLCQEGLLPQKDMTDIHSHVNVKFSSVSRVDAWFSGERIGESLARVNINQFSRPDKSGPPGYLVTPNTIKYWKGTGEIEDAGPRLTKRPPGLICD